jgi:hypothetical protein
MEDWNTPLGLFNDLYRKATAEAEKRGHRVPDDAKPLMLAGYATCLVICRNGCGAWLEVDTDPTSVRLGGPAIHIVCKAGASGRDGQAAGAAAEFSGDA